MPAPGNRTTPALLSPEAVDAFLATDPLPGSPEFERLHPSVSPEVVRPDAPYRLVLAADVRPERVGWAVKDAVPLGMVTLIVGLGGVGKSTDAVRILAGLSRGTLPGDLFGTQVKVAIASAEDHRAAVIVPRLIAAGADLSRVVFVEQFTDGSPGDIEIDGQVEDLERTLADAGVRALLIDTVVAHIPGGTDTYKEQHVRAVLKPLSHMAERLDMAVLGVMHLNRRDARDVWSRPIHWCK